jgi:glycerophosphoryl diester phosphodiesterase
MPFPSIIENGFQKMADFFFRCLPAKLPPEKKLDQSRLIAHRGEHDNTTTMENTLAAFEKAEAAGVWGIECDVQWTSDHTPVVNHDPNLQRLYGYPIDLSRISFKELQTCCPLVPSLETVVSRFGGRVHLMIEIKKASGKIHDTTTRRRYDNLQEVLASLRPVKDFHLMTLHPQALDPVDRIPREAFAAIAYDMPKQFSDWVHHNGWGGICGHYLLMSPSRVRAHQQHGQRVGTGYAASRNVLFREINRGVDWIFSNNAVAMQRVIHQTRKAV